MSSLQSPVHLKKRAANAQNDYIEEQVKKVTKRILTTENSAPNTCSSREDLRPKLATPALSNSSRNRSIEALKAAPY